MSNFILSPNMSLPVPVVGVDPGPDYAMNLNNSLGILDGHNHVPGSGNQVPSSGLNINSDLPFNSQNATLLRSTRYISNGSPITSASPDVLCTYVSGSDLYYNDNNGNQVRITSGGAVNATSSGITSGTASASFISSILVVTSSTGVGAAIDAGAYILRYSGGYPSPSGNFILLEAPSSLSSGYSITFPASTPAASGALLTENTSGILSYTNVDNSTLTISGGVIAVPSGGITNSQIATGTINGFNIGTQTITATNIATGTITATQIETNTSLNGTAVQAGGRTVVVGNTNTGTNQSLLQGGVNSSGSVTSGSGFTTSRTSLGNFQVTFTTPFATQPAIVVTVNASGSAAPFIASVWSSGVSGFHYNTGTTTTLSDQAVNFIAMGGR